MEPEWLKSLSGLLSDSQVSFVASVCSKLRDSGQLMIRTPEARIEEVKQMADKMKDALKLLVEKLHVSVSSRQRFLEMYPTWRRLRDTNVRHLKEIASSIDANKKESQELKVFGSAISFVGGLICFAAGGNVSKMLGGALMGLGTLGSAGTSVEEQMSLQKDIEKAKQIVKRDKDSMEILLKFLDNVSCLGKAVDLLNSINCDEEFVKVAEKFENVSKRNLSAKVIKEELQKILKSIDLPLELKEEISNIVGILISLYMLVFRYKHVFAQVLEHYVGRDAISQLYLSADLMRAAYVGMSSVGVVAKSGPLTSDLMKKVCNSMLFNAINIALVSAQDPNSAEGREIREIAIQLEEEADKFKELYEEIRTIE